MGVLLLSGFGVAASSTASAAPVLIDFDTLADFELVSNQFPEATFSTGLGFELRAFNVGGAFGTSAPNILCAIPTGNLNCADSPGPITVAFTTPVSGLSFQFCCDNNVGVIGSVDVFVNFVFAGTIDIIGDSNPFVDTVSFGAFSNITSIEIRSIIDLGGLAYDNFSFETSAVGVPEPTTLALVGLGLAAMAGRRRRVGGDRR